MTMSQSYYPTSMQYMDAPIRDKAFDIFNALLDEGYEDDQAIPIAIAQAKKMGASGSIYPRLRRIQPVCTCRATSRRLGDS